MLAELQLSNAKQQDQTIDSAIATIIKTSLLFV
jgi:hypothetical protein